MIASLAKSPVERCTASDLLCHAWLKPVKIGERRTSLGQHPGLRSSIKSENTSVRRRSVEFKQPGAGGLISEARQRPKIIADASRTKKTSGFRRLVRRVTAPERSAMLQAFHRFTGDSSISAGQDRAGGADATGDSFPQAPPNTTANNCPSRLSKEAQCVKLPDIHSTQLRKKRATLPSMPPQSSFADHLAMSAPRLIHHRAVPDDRQCDGPRAGVHGVGCFAEDSDTDERPRKSWVRRMFLHR